MSAWSVAVGLLIVFGPAVVEGSGRIKGTVTGVSRKAVVAARITARVHLPNHDGLFLTATDETGTYVYTHLPAGLYRVDAHAEGYETASFVDVEVHPPFRNILDFRMPASGQRSGATDVSPPGGRGGLFPGQPTTVTGRVLGAESVPVPDAEVVLVGGPDPGRRMVLSRADGAFTMMDVSPGVYGLLVTAPGSIPIRVPQVSIEPGRPLDVRVRLVDFPVRLAVQTSLILPPETPLPPRRWWQIPAPPPEAPQP